MSAGKWSLGLVSAMKCIDNQVISSDISVAIRDKFPKARHHFLVLPWREVANIFSLTENDVDLLDELELMATNVIEVLRLDRGNFKMGYHAAPSMHRLHLHLISKDFDSECLKTKKHWNSFNTDFFLSTEDVRNQLISKGHIDKLPADVVKRLMDTPLKCNRCNEPAKTMPALKLHLKSCRH